MTVPEILLSGNHPAVAEWRRQQAEIRSREAKEIHKISCKGNEEKES